MDRNRPARVCVPITAHLSDLTDREWALIAPLLPGPRPLGRPRTTNLRDVMNAILYLASGGCARSLLPRDFPPRSTVERYFYAWCDNGVLRTINHHLVAAARDLEGGEASPTAGRHRQSERQNNRKRDRTAAYRVLVWLGIGVHLVARWRPDGSEQREAARLAC